MNSTKLTIEEIVDDYLDAIYNFVFRLSGNREEASDITQEVFIKVWKNLNHYKPERSFKTWIFSIARYTTIDWLRKKHPILFSKLDQQEDIKYADSLIDDQPLPDELFATTELRQKLSEALSKISLEKKAVILLHLEQGLTFAEIAEISDRPINTIKSLYRRGLEELRREIPVGTS